MKYYKTHTGAMYKVAPNGTMWFWMSPGRLPIYRKRYGDKAAYIDVDNYASPLSFTSGWNKCVVDFSQAANLDDVDKWMTEDEFFLEVI